MNRPSHESSQDRYAAASEFADEFMDSHPEISGALIVGSVATGDDGPHSDVDLRLFNTEMGRGERPKRVAGRWTRDVYVDVSEVPDAWLSDPEWIAGCPRNGSAFRFGRPLRDPETRITRMLECVSDLFDRIEYHSQRVKIYREIVVKRIDHSIQAVKVSSLTDICRSLPFSIIDASLMPAICVGVSPSAIRSLVQLRSIDSELFNRFITITAPPGVGTEMVGKWLEDEMLVSAANETEFTNHVYDQVAGLASDANTVAAAHILWALVYFCLNSLDDSDDSEPNKVVEAKAQEWLSEAGWSDRTIMRTKLDQLRAFVDESISELFPHSPTFLDEP